MLSTQLLVMSSGCWLFARQPYVPLVHWVYYRSISLNVHPLDSSSIYQCIPINCIIHPFISCNNLLHFLCMPLFFCSRLLPSIHYPYNSSTNGTIHPNVQPFTPNCICSSIYQFRNLATDCTVPSTPTTPASYASNNLEVIRSPFSSSSLGWTKETLDGEREVSRP